MMSSEIRTGRHCIFNLHVHLVFVTKYRKKVFTKAVLDDMQTIFSGVCDAFEATLVEFDGEDDQAHLLVHYPPKVSISKSGKNNILPFLRLFGEIICGLQATLRDPVAAHLLMW